MQFQNLGWSESGQSHRAPAQPRTTAVGLARGAPAERTCCVTEMASGAPRTAAALHIHHCGSIRRENASHDHFHLSPLHSEESTLPAWSTLCTFDVTRLNFTANFHPTRPTGCDRFWSSWIVGTCIAGIWPFHPSPSPSRTAARPDRPRPTEDASGSAIIADSCRNWLNAAVGN